MQLQEAVLLGVGMLSPAALWLPSSCWLLFVCSLWTHTAGQHAAQPQLPAGWQRADMHHSPGWQSGAMLHKHVCCHQDPCLTLLVSFQTWIYCTLVPASLSLSLPVAMCDWEPKCCEMTVPTPA